MSYLFRPDRAGIRLFLTQSKPNSNIKWVHFLYLDLARVLSVRPKPGPQQAGLSLHKNMRSHDKV